MRLLPTVKIGLMAALNCLELQAPARIFGKGKAEGRVGRDTGGTPEGETPAARRYYSIKWGEIPERMRACHSVAGEL
jgi:hypothetical protein